MTITEQDIEILAIDLLKAQGHHYLSGPDILPGGSEPLRQQLDEVILERLLKQTIAWINPDAPRQAQEDVISQVKQLYSPDLITTNELFHRMLIEGVTTTVNQGGQQRGYPVRLIDFDDPANNTFRVINQFAVRDHDHTKRIDLLLMINGLPLVVIELKKPDDARATLESAFKQLQTYKQAIPNLLGYNSLLVIANGHEARAGSVSAEMNRFMAWKSHDGETLTDATRMSQLEALISGMLNPQTLLDLIRHFTVFEPLTQRDNKTDVTTSTMTKKIAAYHQYYAVNKGITSVVQASSEQGDRKGGIIWHTQGAGKSLSMVFCAGKLAQTAEMGNPTIVVITDRNDLDEQLFDTFASATALLRQKPIQAIDRQHLKKLLNTVSGGIVFTTIQKFQPEDEKAVFDELSARRNIVVIVDEAHRTQYGFKARTLSVKNAEGEIIGQKIGYGFAKYLGFVE
ncbi:MAG: type I restriction endonuclease subunit R [Gammaproteobacteria bacterium]|nr:type I restriction endonuclease subunit R [Gammaproteobacteria bacterium]